MSPAAPLVSRYTYRLHVRAAILEGLFSGLIVTNDVVAQKTLGATQWQIVLLTMAPNVLQLLAPLAAREGGRVARFRLFLAAGLIGRLALLGMAAVTAPWPYLALFVLQSLMQTFIIPAQNALYQQNYAARVRGRLYGRAAMFGTLSACLGALGAGFILDHAPDAYRWLYPAAGAVGFLSCLAYGRIRLRRAALAVGAVARLDDAAAAAPRKGPAALFADTVRETLVLNPAFRRFEAALFVYGLGFMSIQPVFARLFDTELGMSYSDASLAKGVVTNLAIIAVIGWAGRLLHRIGLERLAMASYAALLVFAGGMAFAATPVQAVVLFALYGAGMAGVSIIWTMGPALYAPPGASARYMGVHLALVGVRALLGNVIGGGVADLCDSSRPAFALAAAFFGVAALLASRALRLAHPPAVAPPPAG